MLNGLVFSEENYCAWCIFITTSPLDFLCCSLCLMMTPQDLRHSYYKSILCTKEILPSKFGAKRKVIKCSVSPWIFQKSFFKKMKSIYLFQKLFRSLVKGKCSNPMLLLDYWSQALLIIRNHPQTLANVYI